MFSVSKAILWLVTPVSKFMAVLRWSYSTCMLRARRRTCLFRLKLLQLASFPSFHAGPLCAWQLILRLSESEESLTGTCTQGVLLLEHCYVLRKFAQALLRLDRIIIQLFAMLGHYLRVFLLLFVVEKKHSLGPAIFGRQHLRANRFEELLWGSERKERDSCRRDPCTLTLVALQHVPAIAVVTLA